MHRSTNAGLELLAALVHVYGHMRKVRGSIINNLSPQFSPLPNTRPAD